MSAIASYPALQDYLARLHANPDAGTRVWIDAAGRAQGRFFHSTLTSAFQPIRLLDSGDIVGYEGFARSYADADGGLAVWKLLDHAANDDESVELDRLCRMLHAINFFRQEDGDGKDLYLSVHARLLAAVEGNHGTAFSRILKLLGLPQQRVILQLPVIVEHQAWLVNYVADNYRRNGFRIALNSTGPVDALALVRKVRPEVIKLDARESLEDGQVFRLLDECDATGTQVIFKRVQTTGVRDVLERIAAVAGRKLAAQGFLMDTPAGELVHSAPRAAA
jgi:EAL domain-containing protein (putative c-di-GMP-specific phosphodiesterase class I)